MDLDQFLELHGLMLNPFGTTNAEVETHLDDCFVRPPYFSSVLGSPSSPKSCIVFAPRGGGKTAQRRFVELEAERVGRYLTVLYSHFPLKHGERPADISLDRHLDNVCQRITLGILLTLDRRGDQEDALDERDRAVLLAEAARLEDLTRDDFEEVVQSLKSFGKKAAEWLSSHSGPIKAIVSAVLKKSDIELDPEQPWTAVRPPGQDASPLLRLERLAELVTKIGFQSTYVLVDKLDETTATATDPRATFDLVGPILTSMPVLEMKRLCFKTFIWDLAAPAYKESGGRPDRIPEFSLEWTPAGLDEMMRRRLDVYSNGQVKSVDDLVDSSASMSLHAIASYFAFGSPRDMIRLCARVVDEHLNTPSPSRQIGMDSVYAGLRRFSTEIAQERGDKFMSDLRRLESFRFTQTRLANDILKIKKQSVQTKVADWRKTSMIDKIAEIPDARSRPQHLYAVVDPRLAVAVRLDTDVWDIMEFYMTVCPSCSTLNIADETSLSCSNCKANYAASAAKSLLEICSRAQTV
jgi:hypothetical protein